MSGVPEPIVQAYRSAIYEIDGPAGCVEARIDVPNAACDRLLAAAAAPAGAIITAYNPASVPLCEAENRAAHENLLQELKQRGLTSFPTRGLDPQERWPAEPGVFVMGLSCDEAAGLARRFDQNGFVWVATGHAPELVLVR